MDTKTLKAKNNESGTFTQTVSVAEVSTAHVSPVPQYAPGVIVAKIGTSEEEHIYYKSKDDGAGTVSGLIRDYTNLNGGTGREHVATSAWETSQSSEYINNLVDAIQQGYHQEMNTIAYVGATQFTVATDQTSFYTVGRVVRFNQDNTKIGIVSSSSYSSGTGLTTVTIGVGTVPATLTHVEQAIMPKGATDQFVTLVGATNLPLATPKITTSINDANGNEVIKTPAAASAVNEVTVKNAATGASPSLEMTGDDTNIGLDVKMKGTGKYRKPTIVEIMVVDPATDTATGDGKAFFRVPEELNGMNLTGVAASVYTAGTTNTTDVQLRNKTDSVDMLSTKLTVDSGETDTSTAATAPVIDTTKDDVATGDVIAIDIDAVSTTAAKGLLVQMRFELP